MALQMNEWIMTLFRLQMIGVMLKDPAVKAQFKAVLSSDPVLAPIYENIRAIVEDVQD